MNSGRWLLSVAIGAVLFLFCCAGVGLPLMMLGDQQAQAAACQGVLSDLAPSDSASSDWTPSQRAHARTIVLAGQPMGVPVRGLVIALATAMQESGLRNLANDNPAYPLVRDHSLALQHDAVGSDHDSVGLFQQRPSPPEGSGGWGTVAELMTPATSARKFYAKLLTIPQWQTMRLTEAAQAVQHSAFPEAYQRHEAAAAQLAAQVLGVASIESLGGGAPGAPCGPAGFAPIPVGPGGWVQPVRASINSGFRTADRPGHDGVDLGAPRGTPIHAASSGIVEFVGCQSSVGCGRDGSRDVRGCGWYVDIRHLGNVVTRYCHMKLAPFVKEGQSVKAGQVIGLVGSTGNSSGPHLHFETHLDVPAGPLNAGSGNAVDPVAFMNSVGAPLGM